MKTSEILESFVSNLTKQSSKNLTDLLKQEFGVTNEVVYSEFYGMSKGTDAEYMIVTFDKDEEVYIINRMKLCHHVQRGIELVDVSPTPEEEFEKLADAKKYVDKKSKPSLPLSSIRQSSAKITPAAHARLAAMKNHKFSDDIGGNSSNYRSR